MNREGFIFTCVHLITSLQNVLACCFVDNKLSDEIVFHEKQKTQ